MSEVASEFAKVQTLVPEWLSEELVYARKKFGNKNPQRALFVTGLQLGASAYQEVFGYLSRFFSYTDPSYTPDEALSLYASRSLGKLAGTGRAMVSSFNEKMHDMSLDEADKLTMVQFKEQWLALEGVPEFPQSDYHEQFEAQTEAHLVAVNGLRSQLDAGHQQAMDMLLDQSKWFTAFTLMKSVMATPGTASNQFPTAWSEYHPPTT